MNTHIFSSFRSQLHNTLHNSPPTMAITHYQRLKDGESSLFSPSFRNFPLWGCWGCFIDLCATSKSKTVWNAHPCAHHQPQSFPAGGVSDKQGRTWVLSPRSQSSHDAWAEWVREVQVNIFASSFVAVPLLFALFFAASPRPYFWSHNPPPFQLAIPDKVFGNPLSIAAKRGGGKGGGGANGLVPLPLVHACEWLDKHALDQRDVYGALTEAQQKRIRCVCVVVCVWV